jgi:hypothetical protein
MANSVMLFPRPETTWTADPARFADAARERWPDAVVGEAEEPGSRKMVGIQAMPAGGPGLDGQFVIGPDGNGSFSMRTGTNRPTIEMLTWVRDWLGPENEVVVLDTGTGFRMAEVPYGADVDEVLAIVRSVEPRARR